MESATRGALTRTRRDRVSEVEQERREANLQPPAAAEARVTTHGPPRWAEQLLLCTLVAAATLLVYRETLDHGFVTMDDYPYVVENVHLQGGLTWDTFTWAAQTFHRSSWFPLTWLSLALDFELTGLDPHGYHRTNLLLHVVNAVLLYLALASLTGARWRSLLTASVFALHPIHVESVAWVSERKDVLSGFFFMLTLWAWARFAKRTSPGRYALVLIAAALGLLSKSSLVTLPCVLLLLDFWPLGRLNDRANTSDVSPRLLARALIEKIPLFALATFAAVTTYRAGMSSSALETTQSLSLVHRAANAANAYAYYLRDSIWPTNLAAFYPHPGEDVSLAGATAATALLLAITAFSLWKFRVAPQLAVGWLWFLGMLVPMIGLVQAGPQARADRFMYLPQIGLCIAVLWSISDRALSRRSVRSALAALAIASLVAWSALTRTQLRVWRDGIALFEHASAVTKDNAFTRHGLGQAYWRDGRLDDAAHQFRAALKLAPHWEKPMAALGGVMKESNQPQGALTWYRRVLELRPEYVEIRNSLAELLIDQGKAKQAIAHLQKVLATQDPAKGGIADDDARTRTHGLLGLACAQAGRPLAAAKHYRAALALRPDHASIHANLGFLLASESREDEALSHLSAALRLGSDEAEVHFARANLLLAARREREGIAALHRAVGKRPDWLAPTNNLAWHLVSASDEDLRDPVEALRLARRAATLSKHANPSVLETLAVALEANQETKRAAAVFDEALALARTMGDAQLVARLSAHRRRLSRSPRSTSAIETGEAPQTSRTGKTKGNTR